MNDNFESTTELTVVNARLPEREKVYLYQRGSLAEQTITAERTQVRKRTVLRFLVIIARRMIRKH